MQPSRTFVVAAVLVGAVAPPARAATTYALDGHRKTHVRITETLHTAALRPATIPTNVLSVDPSDCQTQARSCVVAPLRLSLRKGRSAGIFTVAVAAPRGLNIAVALYDAAGRRLRQADVLTDRYCCQALRGTFVYKIAVPRLEPERYKVIVYDRGGAGGVTVDIGYKELPPDREVAS